MSMRLVLIEDEVDVKRVEELSELKISISTDIIFDEVVIS